MTRYRIYFQTLASTSIEADVPDDITDPEEIAEWAQMNADMPNLCHHCAGGTKFERQNLTLGDEWEPLRENGKPVINPA